MIQECLTCSWNTSLECEPRTIVNWKAVLHDKISTNVRYSVIVWEPYLQVETNPANLGLTCYFDLFWPRVASCQSSSFHCCSFNIGIMINTSSRGWQMGKSSLSRSFRWVWSCTYISYKVGYWIAPSANLSKSSDWGIRSWKSFISCVNNIEVVLWWLLSVRFLSLGFYLFFVIWTPEALFKFAVNAFSSIAWRWMVIKSRLNLNLSTKPSSPSVHQHTQV